MVMENHLVVLLLSVVILIGAFYGYTVGQKIFQIKNDLLKHEKEIKKVEEVKDDLESTKQEFEQLKVELKAMHTELTEVKVDLESTRKEHKEVNEELESTKKEVTKVKVELESTKNEVKQVELELGSTRKELKQVNVELESKKNEVKQVKIELDTTKKEVKQVKAELDKIKTDCQCSDRKITPAFSSVLTHAQSVSANVAIKFDRVVVNFKNDYDPTTGIFTAPRKGVYHISSTVMNAEGHLLLVSLYLNDVQVSSIWLNPSSRTYEMGTTNMILDLKEGDKVSIRSRGSYTVHSNQYIYSSFSGYLIMN